MSWHRAGDSLGLDITLLAHHMLAPEDHFAKHIHEFAYWSIPPRSFQCGLYIKLIAGHV